MTATLQEAIAAARAGDPERAQILAADVVRNNPNDPNGWYLLSQLVDSDARRAAYLSKTLALDPTYDRARAEFSALPPALVSDLAAQTAVGEPAAGEVLLSVTDEDLAEFAAPAGAAVAVAPDGVAVEAPVAAAALTEVPDWLQPLAPEPTPVETIPPAQPRPSSPAPRPRPVAAKPRPQSNRALTILLGLLGLLTVLVLVFLLYLLFA